MKKFLRRIRIATVVSVLVLGARAAAAAPVEVAELMKARAHLLEAYSRGLHDDDENVKQTKAEIARLEYLVAHAENPTEPPRLVSVNFPGGSAAALIAAADKSSAEGFNVIGEKADLAIDVPAFSIRNADPNSLAFALDGILRQRGYTLQTNFKPGQGQAPIFVLRRLNSYEQRIDGMPFESFQLATYLEGQSVDDIIGAIHTAWELDPAHRPEALRLKFHPPTNILLVSGPVEGINTVRSVLGQLRRASDQKPNPKPAPPSAEKK